MPTQWTSVSKPIHVRVYALRAILKRHWAMRERRDLQQGCTIKIKCRILCQIKVENSRNKRINCEKCFTFIFIWAFLVLFILSELHVIILFIGTVYCFFSSSLSLPFPKLMYWLSRLAQVISTFLTLNFKNILLLMFSFSSTNNNLIIISDWSLCRCLD